MTLALGQGMVLQSSYNNLHSTDITSVVVLDKGVHMYELWSIYGKVISTCSHLPPS